MVFEGHSRFYSIPLYIPYPLITHKLPYYPGRWIPPFNVCCVGGHRGHHSHLQQGFIFCCHIIFGHCISWFFAQTLQHFAQEIGLHRCTTAGAFLHGIQHHVLSPHLSLSVDVLTCLHIKVLDERAEVGNGDFAKEPFLQWIQSISLCWMIWIELAKETNSSTNSLLATNMKLHDSHRFTRLETESRLQFGTYNYNIYHRPITSIVYTSCIWQSRIISLFTMQNPSKSSLTIILGDPPDPRLELLPPTSLARCGASKDNLHQS